MKVKFLILCCCLFVINLCPVYSETDLAPTSSSAILMDAESASVLYEKNMHEPLYPASMTKMMSLYLVLKSIHQGAFGWDDIVVASEHAASLGGSQIYLEPGERMSVLDLFKASTVASANDAVTALAEKVAGSEAEFVRMMNDTASSFGCKNTHFVNPTGLHDDKHVSSAYDMAIIAKNLIDEGNEELLQYTSLMEDYIREDTDHKFWLVNTNKMLRSYPGMDGLKTGYTSQSMYCITVTAQRNGMRLIAVVMHEPDKASRSKDAAALLDYGFARYQKVNVMNQQEYSEMIRIDKGFPDTIKITNDSQLGYTAQIGVQKQELERSILLNDIIAPVHKGDIVGHMMIKFADGSILSTNLIACESSERLSFWAIFRNCMNRLLF
ncbi:MAG: D-alanyl-D-alanine carboxypeptidase [Erysipelotrichaceae bacterium]|nr:D-alanyl-D-alanine carboxypeptidase [Erysipelotrichaceae bacterium]